jgi:L-threonylcarbamoyladenylate synthase
LGADAFSPTAVSKIFKVKGRPPANPLLVHISSIEQLKSLVTSVNNDAMKLIKKYWPGPLSIILPAADNVPDIVRGGGTGVGLRMPDHPVALELISQAGPLAAPSANLYGRPSPVNAEHVKEDLDGKIAMVLDAGQTGLGVESTVIDMQSNYKVLRQGGVPVEDIERVIGKSLEIKNNTRKYSAKIPVVLAANTEQLDALINKKLKSQQKIVLVHNNLEIERKSYQGVYKEYDLDLINKGGVQFYSIIRECEEHNIDMLVFAPIPGEAKGTTAALLERIQRAASNIKNQT